MYGYIYLTTNLLNNKKYIGQHRSDTFDSAYCGSGTLFVKALKKYHKENFKTEILDVCETEDELNEKEVYYIEKYDAVNDPMFYNISFGGYKQSIRNLVSMYNPNTDHIMYCAKSLVSHFETEGYTKGNRPRSEATKKKLSDIKKQMIVLTNDVETIYCFPDNVEAYLAQGYRFGRIPSRPNQKSENRKWMHNDTTSVMVKPEDFQTYLEKGYLFGRLKFEHFNRVAPAHNKGKVKVIVDGNTTYVEK